jgi:hypothetical protein
VLISPGTPAHAVGNPFGSVEEDVIPPEEVAGADASNVVAGGVVGEIMKGVAGIAVVTGSVLVIDVGGSSGLTPPLPISKEPNGIPVRATPPGVTGDVAANDALEVVPHGPDAGVLPGIDIPAPIPIPPPSKVVVEPDIADNVLPVVGQGNGLSPGDASCVAPIGIPVGATDEPGVMPSGDVAPMVGVRLTCARAGDAIASAIIAINRERYFIEDSNLGFGAISRGFGSSRSGSAR